MKLKKEYCIAVITASMLLTTGIGSTATFSEAKTNEVTVEKSNTIHNEIIFPEIKMIKGKTANTVEIVLEDAEGFNLDTLWDKSNYTIKGPIKVQDVISVTTSTNSKSNSDDNDTNNNIIHEIATVVLRTDEFKEEKSQRITISNITDASGNEMPAKMRAFGPRLIIPSIAQQPSIQSVNVSNDNNEIIICFNSTKGLNKNVAENKRHYFIEGVEILNAKVQSSNPADKNTIYDKVILTTVPLEANTEYELCVKYIEDGSPAHTANFNDLISKFISK